MDQDTLRAALERIGADPESRAAFLDALRVAERRLARRDVNVREETTGPLTDALFGAVDAVDVRLADGTELALPYRSRIARDLVLRRDEHPDHVFEPQATKLLRRLARGARHVLIGGAYVGDHAVPLARAIAAEGGVVHAFEPNPELHGFLVENARRNGLTNVRANRLGLWDRSDTGLKLSGHDAYAFVEPTDEAGAIPSITIDDYGAREGVEAFDVIMIDVEGSERTILRGAQRYLAQPADRAPHLIYEVHRSYVDWSHGLDRTEIVAMLARLGYASYGIRDYQDNVPLPGVPVELVPVATAYLEGPAHGFNVFATKRAALLDDPLLRVVPDVSPKYLHHRDPALHAPLAFASLG